jgi:hypothetical protein
MTFLSLTYEVDEPEECYRGLALLYSKNRVIPICTVSIRVESGKHIFRTLYFIGTFSVGMNANRLGD